jgi:hypothetical protein
VEGGGEKGVRYRRSDKRKGGREGEREGDVEDEEGVKRWSDRLGHNRL